MKITIPGAVYDDYLDPLCTDMESELGLGNPDRRKVGRGHQFIYNDVPTEVAKDLADYLQERADLLLANDDQDSCHYTARRTAEKIYQQVHLDKLHMRNN